MFLLGISRNFLWISPLSSIRWVFWRLRVQLHSGKRCSPCDRSIADSSDNVQDDGVDSPLCVESYTETHSNLGTVLGRLILRKNTKSKRNTLVLVSPQVQVDKRGLYCGHVENAQYSTWIPLRFYSLFDAKFRQRKLFVWSNFLAWPALRLVRFFELCRREIALTKNRTQHWVVAMWTEREVCREQRLSKQLICPKIGGNIRTTNFAHTCHPIVWIHFQKCSFVRSFFHLESKEEKKMESSRTFRRPEVDLSECQLTKNV